MLIRGEFGGIIEPTLQSGTVSNESTRKFLQGFMERYVAWTRKFS